MLACICSKSSRFVKYLILVAAFIVNICLQNHQDYTAGICHSQNPGFPAINITNLEFVFMVDVVGPSAVPDIAPAAPSRYQRLRDRIDFGSVLQDRFAQAESARIEQQQALAFAAQAGLTRLAGANTDKEISGQQNSAATATAPSDLDLRARLRAKPDYRAYKLLYNDNPWLNLQNYGGMIWPYTPTITYTQDVSYESMNSVHTNQEMLSYTRTPATKLSVAGSFSSQTQREATYNLACIHFLRLVTKMSFGASNKPQPGTPPPVLFFDAHGGGMFKSLPVVVTNFSITLPNEPDYVVVDTALEGILPRNKTTRVPALFDITVSLTVQHTPKALREWSIDTFRRGGYITDTAKPGWI